MPRMRTGPANRLLQAATLALIVVLGATERAGARGAGAPREPAPAPVIAQKTVPVPDANAARNHGHGPDASAHGVRASVLVELALTANPELAAMRREFDAARARIPREKALPNPMLMVNNMTIRSPVPFTGMSGEMARISVGVSQEVPWLGVRRLRGQVASAEAEAKYQEYSTRVRRVTTEVKSAAYELYSIHKALAVLRRDVDILNRFAQIAEARYTVGKAEQVDVINARLEITELLDTQGTLEMRHAAVLARLNALLFRDPDTPVDELATPATVGVLPPLGELVELARANAPDLKEQRRMIDARSHALRLAEREAKYPNVSFTFFYHNRPAWPDMYEYGVTLELPLWSFNKQRYGIEEQAANLAAARSRLDAVDVAIRSQLREAYVRATTAARLIRLHEQGLIPQATLALESAMASYQVGKVDFGTLLAALGKALRYETHYYEMLAEYHVALAEIEAFAGVELTR